MGIANVHNNRGSFKQAIATYMKYLDKINQSQQSKVEISQSHPSIGRAFYNLAFAHYQLGEYPKAVHFYKKSAKLAERNGDKVALARSSCNLGLSHKQMGNTLEALECQENFLRISREVGSRRGELKAQGNIGDLYKEGGRNEEACEVYKEQLELARKMEEPSLVAQSLSSVGNTLRCLKRNNEALEYHVEEVEIYRGVLKDNKNEFKAQGRLGANLTVLEKYEEAKCCYERQVEISNRDSEGRKMQALSNLAIANTNLGEFESAVGYLQEQLVLLTQKNLKDAETLLKVYNAHYRIADCWFAAESYSESNEHFLKAFEIATSIQRHDLTEMCLESIVTSYNVLNELDRAVHFARLRLTNARTHLGDYPVAAALGDLGVLLTQAGKFDEAVEHLKEQMRIGVEMGEARIKSDAASALGSAYELKGDFHRALDFHKLDLEISEGSDAERAVSNLAGVCEKMGDYENALVYYNRLLCLSKDEAASYVECLLSVIRLVIRYT